MFKVERGVAMPRSHANRKPTGKLPNWYPFHELEIGDSFFVPALSGLTDVRHCLAAAAHGHGRTHGRTMAIRQVEGGLRCWRIA
jgi:hypothetical protein